MPGWFMILLGLSLLYFLVGAIAYFVGWGEDSDQSKRRRKQNANDTMLFAWTLLTISLVVIAVGVTAIYLIFAGILSTIPL